MIDFKKIFELKECPICLSKTNIDVFGYNICQILEGDNQHIFQADPFWTGLYSPKIGLVVDNKLLYVQGRSHPDWGFEHSILKIKFDGTFEELLAKFNSKYYEKYIAIS